MALISWIGTIASVLGSFLVAFGILGVGYVAFLIGSVSWLYVSWNRRDLSLGSLNGVFLAANLVGLYRVFT